jgi:hypothetical protein
MAPSVRSVLVGLLILAAGAERAEASCIRPEWIGTPAGVTVPEKGVLYRFSALEGAEARMERYDAAGAEALGFVVDEEWAPPAEAPRVLAIQHSKYAWTCSDENALAIQLDQPVAAVRVFWATSEGQREMVVAPRPRETPKGRPASVLLLGGINCAGENIPVADLERGVVLGLTAIRFDGSEVAIDGVPTIVAFDDYPVSKNGVSPLGFDAVVEEVAQVADAEPWRPKTNGAFPIALVLGAIVLGARRGIAGARACEVKLPSATAKR